MESPAITLVPIGNGSPCTDTEIQRRVATSPKGKRTTQFVAYRDKCEVGFVALDDIPELDCLVLYELFIPAQLRGSGLGTRLLKKVEAIGRAEGYRRITLFPRPLEPGFPAERLLAWYYRHGYAERADCPTELEKTI
ncbi:GNAT superfamily N-acetyltransferase [Bradyrhizobium sp. RT9b]|uniref:GNAT family N-acetyltransferase n=1 Tax=Bradyrhizobium sp. RT9b TaxID=3156385 RepID=UPI0033941125